MAKTTQVEIFERRHDVKFGYDNMRDLMTPEQFERGQYYRQKYLDRRGEMDFYKEEFDSIYKLYSCERDPDSTDPTYPNNMIPLIAPVVEGQVAAMLESDIDYIYTSNNPSHQKYLPKLESVSAYCRDLNKAQLHYKDYARQYEVLGNAWLTVLWEKSYSNEPDKQSGYPRIIVPPIMSVLVDGRIKDYKDLQHSEYIIHEIGFQDIAWARKTFGKEKAECIARALNRYDGIDTEELRDDTNTFMLLNVWTRDNEEGKLELIQMDSTGFILEESFPYTNVDNEYPFWFGRMIPRNGRFYGYGDGKLLKYMQIFVNRLADEMELAARFNAQPKVFVDARGGMDLDQFDSDPSHPIMCENPNQNVYALQGQGISQVVPQMIQFLLDQSQRATRFSDIMTGNQQGVSATATQISGQLAQGAVGIKDKASDIQNAMAWCDMYCMKLCLQFWDVPFWVSKFRTTGESEFIDMSALAKVPAVVPQSGKTFLERIGLKKKNPNIPVVNYEAVNGKNGEPILINLSYQVKVRLSSGFATGKNDTFNRIMSLIQLPSVTDPATGMVTPFMSINIARKKMEEILGYKISEDAAVKKLEPMLSPMDGTAPLNPMGNSGEVVQPQGSQVQAQPSNLMGTVPMANDKRGLQL